MSKSSRIKPGPLDPTIIVKKVKAPVAIILGSPAEAAHLVASLPTREIVCYQMDLYQAERLQESLKAAGLDAKVITSPDLWDLPADLQTVLYPVPEKGERALKLDMIEQAFHILRPAGNLVAWSSYRKDSFLPNALKKVFRRAHSPQTEGVQAYWSPREGDRPRRRHEMAFQVRVDDASLRFISRPGVFSYGRFDNGARALVETMEIHPGDQVVDVGCGCGTNGIIAGRRTGPDGRVAFIDSNVRALALAEQNARNNGLTNFQTVASSQVEGLAASSFDVALANPPYYAQGSIARMFVERARTLLRPGGRLYLVTKQPDQVGPFMADTFGHTEVVTRRGYSVLCA